MFLMNIYGCLQIVYFEFLFLQLNYRELIFIMLSQMFVISSLQDSVSGMRLSIHMGKSSHPCQRLSNRVCPRQQFP